MAMTPSENASSRPLPIRVPNVTAKIARSHVQ
jgi:hypothetical protein